MSRISLIVFLAVVGVARADDPIRLVEKAATGTQFRIVSNSSISGELLTPIAKDKPAERIKIQGKSTIDYAERILAVDVKDADHKALRVYEKIEFRKTAGDRTDEMTLRPAVRRLVVMKKGHAKVPFSPDAPMTWAEIDMLRTDFVVAVLAGLLPANEVRLGDTWKASAAAIAELTDLDKVDKGELICKLDKVLTAGPRRLAQVSFAGNLQGVNEDGPTRQKIDGRLLLDLAAECITFLRIEGEHFLLDAAGMEAGKIAGTFELTRAPVTDQAALSDKALKGVELNPSEENTRLLYDSLETGVRFVHPRHWRVVRTSGRQITLDETDGAGLLITLETADGIPTPARYQREAMKELQERGAKLTNQSGPERLADGVERFTLDAELSKEKVTMDYIVIRQDKGGATLAARLPTAQRDARMKELERLARSFVVARALDGK